MTYEQEMEIMKRDPYSYIKSFYEKMYPHMGNRVMSVLSLLPCSLIIPPLIDSNGKKIRARLNYLLLAPPGTAKSALSAHFKKFTYNPFPFESISDSKLNFVLAYKKRATLITSDIARVFSDNSLVKEMENIIGDEGKLSRLNRNTGDEELSVDANAYLAGTPENLNKTIQDGIIFRVCADIIYHTESEHSDILEQVNLGIGAGINSDFLDKEKVIVDFYQKLLSIQESEKEAELNKITGYKIPDSFRNFISQKIIPMFNLPFKQTNFEFVRELQQCYRYMISHAFLNIFNRKIEDGKIIIQEEDLKVATDLSIREINTKLIILNSLNRVSERRFRTTQELKAWAYEQKARKTPLSMQEYKTMEFLVRG